MGTQLTAKIHTANQTTFTLWHVCLRPILRQSWFGQALLWAAWFGGVLCKVCRRRFGQANVSTAMLQGPDQSSRFSLTHHLCYNACTWLFGPVSCQSVHWSIAVTPVGLDTAAAVLEGRVRAEILFRSNYPSLPFGPDKQSKRSHCRERSTRVSAMARPAGRLASLLQSQSAGAKAAIEAHLAPAVAKGSVHSHVMISLSCFEFF